MIGYYVHHQGRGHLHRATVLATALSEGDVAHEVTGLSSLPRPTGWSGPWVELPWDADHLDASVGHPVDAVDPTAGGALHWAPLSHPGLRRRTAAVSSWLERTRPRLVVCDVSQEMVLLCRLHGVPVVSVVQPGSRVDLPHQLGLRAATYLAAFWPVHARDLLTGVPEGVVVDHLGALSRFPPVTGLGGPAQREDGLDPPGPRRLVVLGGRGGDAWSPRQLDALLAGAAGWEVTVLGPGASWAEDPWAVLRIADVVVTHAGQNALAEVAAARVPAVVVPAARPFEEQVTTARVLGSGPWPVRSLDLLEHPDWPRLLDEVAALDGADWASWCDGRAAARFAHLVRRAAAPRRAAELTS